jgi:hypothetical protein
MLRRAWQAIVVVTTDANDSLEAIFGPILSREVLSRLTNLLPYRNLLVDPAADRSPPASVSTPSDADAEHTSNSKARETVSSTGDENASGRATASSASGGTSSSAEVGAKSRTMRNTPENAMLEGEPVAARRLPDSDANVPVAGFKESGEMNESAGVPTRVADLPASS